MKPPYGTVLVAGSTGLTGKHVVRALIDSGKFEKIRLINRRPAGFDHAGVEELIANPEDWEKHQNFFRCEHFVCCLGTTIKKAGSKKAFYHVDAELPLKLAKLCIEQGCRYGYHVSSVGADAKSSIYYSHVKGTLEAELAKLPFAGLHIFRPSLLLGDRNESRPAEWLSQKILGPLAFLFAGPLLKYRPIRACKLAKTIVRTIEEPVKTNEIHEGKKLFLS